MLAIIEDKKTNDIQDVIKYAEENRLNVYNGYDENSSAFIYSFKDHLKAIKIIYDDIYDCKKTELILKQVCPKFYPRRYIMHKWKKSITISQDCKSELDELQKGTESYEMIIWRLLLHYKGLI